MVNSRSCYFVLHSYCALIYWQNFFQGRIIFATIFIHYIQVTFMMLRLMFVAIIAKCWFWEDLILQCLCCSTTAVISWRYCSIDYTAIIKVLYWIRTFLGVLILREKIFDETSYLYLGGMTVFTPFCHKLTFSSWVSCTADTITPVYKKMYLLGFKLSWCLSKMSTA